MILAPTQSDCAPADLPRRICPHMVCQYDTFLKGFLNFDILIEKCNRNWSYVRKLVCKTSTKPVTEHTQSWLRKGVQALSYELWLLYRTVRFIAEEWELYYLMIRTESVLCSLPTQTCNYHCNKIYLRQISVKLFSVHTHNYIRLLRYCR